MNSPNVIRLKTSKTCCRITALSKAFLTPYETPMTDIENHS